MATRETNIALSSVPVPPAVAASNPRLNWLSIWTAAVGGTLLWTIPFIAPVGVGSNPTLTLGQRVLIPARALQIVRDPAPNAGSVAGVRVDDPGYGFSTAPAIGFTGGGGSGAAATATVNAQTRLASVTVTDPGEGYTGTPTVTTTPSTVSVRRTRRNTTAPANGEFYATFNGLRIANNASDGTDESSVLAGTSTGDTVTVGTTVITLSGESTDANYTNLTGSFTTGNVNDIVVGTAYDITLDWSGEMVAIMSGRETEAAAAHSLRLLTSEALYAHFHSSDPTATGLVGALAMDRLLIPPSAWTDG